MDPKTDETFEEQDDQVIDGGPGLGEDESAEDQPEYVEVSFQGKKFKADPALAAALEDYRKEINRRDGTHGSELETLRRQVADLTARVDSNQIVDDEAEEEEEEIAPPDPNLLVLGDSYDPAKYHQQLMAFTEANIASAERRGEKKYMDAEAQKSAEAKRQSDWKEHVDKFYKKNEDLAPFQDVVDMVWKTPAVINEIRNLPVDEGFERLAEIARERIFGIAQKAGTMRAKPKTPHLEGGRPRPQRTEGSEEGEKREGGLSAVIRKKQRAFRQGATA